MNAKRTVLIVDDDELSREVLTILLEAEGYRVEGAAGGMEALTLLSAAAGQGSLPGIVLTDLQMPGLAGKELAEKLRGLCGPSTHLFVMSAANPQPSLIALYDGFLPKPFSKQDFARALETPVTSKSAAQDIAPPDTSMILDEAVYAKLAALMPAQQIVEIYSFCLADAHVRIEHMRFAIHHSDEESLRKQAHTLQGGCGMLGAIELRTLAMTLEGLGGATRTSLELDALLTDLAEACQRLRRMLELRWQDHV